MYSPPCRRGGEAGTPMATRQGWGCPQLLGATPQYLGPLHRYPHPFDSVCCANYATIRPAAPASLSALADHTTPLARGDGLAQCRGDAIASSPPLSHGGERVPRSPGTQLAPSPLV